MLSLHCIIGHGVLLISVVPLDRSRLPIFVDLPVRNTCCWGGTYERNTCWQVPRARAEVSREARGEAGLRGGACARAPAAGRAVVDPW